MIHRGLERFHGVAIRHAVLSLILGAFFTLPSSAGTTTYTYDAQGRLSGVSTQNGLDVQNATVTFDNGDNRTSIVYQYQDHTPPNPPTNLSATPQAYNSILLNWTTSLDVGGGPVQYYKIYRGGSLLTSTASPPYNDQSVVANTAYTYAVSAVDPSSNESAQSAPANATTPPQPDTTPPSVPTNLQGAAVTGTWINLTWNASTDTGGSGLGGYEVFRNNGGSPIGTSTVPSFSDQSAVPATTYLYTVRAYDNAGNRSGMSNQISVSTPDTIAPSTPGNPTFSSIGTTSATANWTPASDNVGVVGYRYSLDGGTNWIYPGNVTTVALTGLAVNTQYTLMVEAYDGAGNLGNASYGSFQTHNYYSDSPAYTYGEVTDGSTYYNLGYSQGNFGSLSPATLTGGTTVGSFTTYIQLYYNGVYWTSTEDTYLYVSGFATNPGASWLQTISVSGGTPLTGASASFSCSGSTCIWHWPGVDAAAGQGPLTIVHE